MITLSPVGDKAQQATEGKWDVKTHAITHSRA
jgi:hypothetical protein